ncbi:hypothetical protein QLL95_gp1157 [Cotonvirus japonicus]|uniref:DUF5672 domain-containing protein n=1 Tax=Cotonvirus japonicus TaxID=2811091 RepID=A0ABM7NS81_9VIRU|nr:hypothetical protein QLL95_gp1157 [Cotonvirus japonicus]BCS82966.1 hypothetical protein [Cotonvirus japonicus]
MYSSNTYNIKSVVIFKTHIWSKEIENFVVKLLAETKSCDTDFYVVIHDENNSVFPLILNSQIKDICLIIKESEIRSIYETGFYDMWLSNHWILMWFYQKYRKLYNYFWSMEYDVRICGDSSLIWTHQSDHDFLYTMGNYSNPKNKYNNHYTGKILSDTTKYHGYLQLARYSNKLLEYLDSNYKLGENGQDEMITFSLINFGKFTKSKEFLQKLIRGTWTWQASYSCTNKKIYVNLINRTPKNQVFILHPIK